MRLRLHYIVKMPNERSGVDAGRASLFAFPHLWPGATHREGWAHRAMNTDSITYGACTCMFVASLVVTVSALLRKGLVGFGFGLLSILGSAISFVFLPFAVAVGVEGHVLTKDFFKLLSMALIGLALFATGTFYGLRRKSA